MSYADAWKQVHRGVSVLLWSAFLLPFLSGAARLSWVFISFVNLFPRLHPPWGVAGTNGITWVSAQTGWFERGVLRSGGRGVNCLLSCALGWGRQGLAVHRLAVSFDMAPPSCTFLPQFPYSACPGILLLLTLLPREKHTARVVEMQRRRQQQDQGHRNLRKTRRPRPGAPGTGPAGRARPCPGPACCEARSLSHSWPHRQWRLKA